MTVTTPAPAGSPVPADRDAACSADSPPGCSVRPLPHVPGVAHRFVAVRGVRMHVAEAGSGDPVLLLHSFPQHWHAWRRVIPLLAGAEPVCLCACLYAANVRSDRQFICVIRIGARRTNRA